MTDKDFIEKLTDVEKKIVAFYRYDEYDTVRNVHDVLEIGSGWGLFTRSILMANDGCRVTTIDKIPEPRHFKENTAGYEDRITRIIGDSKDKLPKLQDKSFDLIYVDGDHGYEGFKRDFYEALRLVRDNGVVVCDDVCHPKNFQNDYGIIKAITEICLNEDMSFGIVPIGHGIAITKKQ